MSGGPPRPVAWPDLELGPAALGAAGAAFPYEWIETNGLGGYALQGVVRPLRRCYSGLLVAAVRPPVLRMVLLARFEEHLVVGGRAHRLWDDRRDPPAADSRSAPAVAPVSFGRYPFPRHTFEIDGCRLRRTVVMPAGRNTVAVRWWLVAADGPVTLVLDPLLAFRDHHDTRRAAGAHPPLEATMAEDVLTLRATDTPEAPALRIHCAGATFVARPGWAAGYGHDVETERGLPDVDDYMTPGLLVARLLPRERFDLVVTTEPDEADAETLEREERRRRAVRLEPLSTLPDWLRRLHLAAEQFLVQRGRGLRSIVAGYPWFTDWGRDSMIALPGLCLVTGQVEEGGAILSTFAAHARNGLLPNHFPDDGEAPHYNTVDASLWFFQALRQYRAAGGSEERARALLPVARTIVAAYRDGTDFGIGCDADGLVRWDAPGQALTWMDARIGDRAFTPRRGFPVEIQALWHAALLELAALERRFGTTEAADTADAQAARVRAAFRRRFWNPASGTLYDVLASDGRPDAAIRPNALFAVSLPGNLLPEDEARSIVRVARERLLTPVGLRSLAPGHADYHPIFTGDRPTRDAAYHQGTVWGWLLGPYAEAVWRTAADRHAARAEVMTLLEQAALHLDEDGLGTFAEVFDAEPPHRPRGCLAQAWSVAELLRVHALLNTPSG